MDKRKVLDKLFDGVKTWTKFGLLWLLLAFVLRLAFFFMLKMATTIDWSAFLTILSGVYFDLAVVFFGGVILLIPFLIINWFLPKTTRVLSMVFITLYVVVYCCLIGYFMNVTQPLDRVFFIYTPEELYNIVVSSVKFSFLPLIGVFVAVLLYSLLLRFWNRKISIGKWMAITYFAIALVFVIVFNYNKLITNGKPYKSHYDYCLAVNQIAYTVNDFSEYYEQNKSDDYSLYDENVLRDAVAYQGRHPDFRYLDIHYPFLRENDDPDILGEFMNKTSDGKAPDFVFIIVESLGQCLSSTAPHLSFTPFIDSLKTVSLYWPNCLALAERTFGVVPNVFSSAPYDKSGFARVWFPIPDHNSILKDMSKNGYSLSFYYGGNAAFDGQNTYMAGNGVSYIMDPNEADFDQEQKEALVNDHSWGMYDRDMFNAAIKHRDTVTRNRPNTDIYITLSTHEPNIFKGQEVYIERVKEMVAKAESFGPREKETVLNNTNVFSSYLYADDCIKSLFEYYKTLPEFENTIFVILGDHRTGNVWVSKDHLLEYNVPLIVYSPLIKSPKLFQGVVTQHDIAPTITSYLKNNYDYQVDDFCHWLGTSLDTSSVFKCDKSVAFMLNNREVLEYLHNDYYIFRDRLYKVHDLVHCEEIEDDSIKNQLKEYLRQYRNVDMYVTRNDFLLKKPDNMTELYNSVKMPAVEYKLNGHSHQRICDPIEFDKKYERVYVDVKFAYEFKNNVNPQDIFVVFYSYDKKPAATFYMAYKFSELGVKTEEGNVVRVKSTFFVLDKEMMDYPFHITIFSNQETDIKLSNVRVKVEAY